MWKMCLWANCLDDINSCRKICPLSMAPFPGWNPGLYDYGKGTEQYTFIHFLFHLTVDEMWPATSHPYYDEL